MNLLAKKERLIILGVFLFAILFRLWFISLAPQPFRFGLDEYEYDQYAQKITNQQFFASHSYRPYPYSLFLAGVYQIVGFGNHPAIFVLQAILDAISGLFLFFICRYTLKKVSLGWIVFLLYSINPFTSGYVGVILSEVLSTFFITATLFFGCQFVKKSTWGNAFLFGIAAGLAAETRNAAFLWAIIPILFALFNLQSSWKKKCILVVMITWGVGITTLYPLYVNWRDYHEINISTVDDFFARELYQGAIITILPPFTYRYPQQSYEMWGEYYSEYAPNRTTAERKQMALKYYQKAIDIMQANPREYAYWRVYKMWYVWQKENVFFYQEPYFEDHKQYTYMLNLCILLFSLIGLVWWKSQKKTVGSFVGTTIVGSIVYATLAFCLTHAEYRLTIPFYPLLILASSMGIYRVVHKISHYFTFG